MVTSTRGDPVECPHCGEVTMPNRLADGGIVCSCAAERPLPVPPVPVAAASCGTK
jgi:formylmethanofuran dehydrogenase subunit E